MITWINMKNLKATNTELYMHSRLGLSHSYLEIRDNFDPTGRNYPNLTNHPA